MSPLEHALAYAGRGWRVFPVSGAKPPTGWPTIATTDPEQIRTWWEAKPDAKVAIATGPGSRLLVIDLDVGHASGVNGLDSWDALIPDGYAFRGPLVQTKSGGAHLYYETDYDYRSKAGRFAEGVDWRSGGGFVYAPPSGYTWLNDSPDYVPPVPDWLHEKLAPKRADGSTPDVVRSRLTELLDNPPTEGGRNVWLSQVCGHYAKRFHDAHDLYVRHVANANDLLGEPLDFEELFRTTSSIWDAEQAKPDHDEEPDDGTGENLEWDTAEGIPSEVAEWTWGERNGERGGRIPGGALTLLAGREGVGKSTLVWDLVGSLTRGDLPGEYWGVPSPVAVVATEDSWGHTIRPRLLAARANLANVWRIKAKKHVSGVTLPRDIEELKRGLGARGAPLVILDPLISRLDAKLDTHKDADVRRALEPLTALAEESGVAILGLIHINKTATNHTLDAIMASKAFVAVARSVLYAAIDPDDKTKPPSRSLLAHSKNNVGKRMQTLAFVIEEKLVDHDAKGREVWATAIRWDGTDDRDDREIMDQTNAAKKETKADRADENAEALRKYLAAQPDRRARKLDVVAHMATTKHKPSARTVERLAIECGCTSTRESVKGGGVWWTLPEEF